MQFVIDRLKEASTYKGLAVLLALAGITLSPAAQVALAVAAPQVISAALACYGVYNVIKKGK